MKLQKVVTQQPSIVVQIRIFIITVGIQIVAGMSAFLYRLPVYWMYAFLLGGPEFIPNTEHLRRWLNRVWSVVIRWEHSFATHQQLLVVLLEWVLPHLDKPLLLTDYLMDSLDMGKQLLEEM